MGRRPRGATARAAPTVVVILPDSSAWIEYLRATGSPQDRRLAELIHSDQELVVTGPVLMEVLAGARDEEHARDLGRLLARCRNLIVEQPADFEAAAAIYRGCRRRGRTVRRLADCLIAAVAIREGAAVLHADADFELIADYASLATVALDA